jgi:hypothetical protein
MGRSSRLLQVFKKKIDKKRIHKKPWESNNPMAKTMRVIEVRLESVKSKECQPSNVVEKGN